MYTSQKVIRLLKRLIKSIKSEEWTIPIDLYDEFMNISLWDKWCEIVDEYSSSLGIVSRRRLAMPDFIDYCKEKTIDYSDKLLKLKELKLR